MRISKAHTFKNVDVSVRKTLRRILKAKAYLKEEVGLHRVDGEDFAAHVSERFGGLGDEVRQAALDEKRKTAQSLKVDLVSGARKPHRDGVVVGKEEQKFSANGAIAPRRHIIGVERRHVVLKTPISVVAPETFRDDRARDHVAIERRIGDAEVKTDEQFPIAMPDSVPPSR